MIAENKAKIKALLKIIDVFGEEYVREHRESPISFSIRYDIYTFSYLFESSEKRLDLEPDHLGWTVYATVEVDMNTGEANMIDYVLPDGTKMKDDIQNRDMV